MGKTILTPAGEPESQEGGRRIPVAGCGPGGQERATELSRELGLQINRTPDPEEVHLLACRDGLSVAGRMPDETRGRVSPLSVDLTALDTSSAAGRRRDQPLLKAVVGKHAATGRVVLDGTGGLGEDAWILAACGCSVVVVEQDELIFALLRDAVARAGVVHLDVAKRLRLVRARAQTVLARSGHVTRLMPEPHVVYVDPFFHAQRKRRGAQKRSMRMLRYVARESSSSEGEDLVDWAVQTARDRAVIKRPARSLPLTTGFGRLSHSVRGRGFRFDVYMPYT